MQCAIKALAVVAIALQTGACATIIEGSGQTISVSSIEQDGKEVGGAECVLTSPAIGTQKVMTPGAVRLDKSKHGVSVVCNKEGYEAGTGTVVSHFAAWTAGNVLIGGLIGVGIDAASGASHKYDDKVVVTMAKKPEPPPEPLKRTATRRVTAPPPASPVPAAVQPAPPIAPPASKPPKCRDVGGYEAYKAKTGEVCEL